MFNKFSAKITKSTKQQILLFRLLLYKIATVTNNYFKFAIKAFRNAL